VVRDTVTGTFTGLAQGAQFKSGSALFQISYTGGTGNYVTVTRINAPVPTAPTVLMNGTTAPASTLNVSRITSLVLTFNTIVTVETGAFSITNGTFTLTDAANAGILVSGSGSTTITLTFDPAVAGVEFGSLADGIW